MNLENPDVITSTGGESHVARFTASTATPEQLLGIVGEARLFQQFAGVNLKTGDYIVTPREDT